MNLPSAQPDRLSLFVRIVWIGVYLYVVGKAVVSPYEHSCYPGYSQSAREWISEGTFEAMNSFQHLPYFSDLLSPFAVFPVRIGAGLWATFVFVVYATGLRAFLKTFPPTSSPAGREIALLCGLLVGTGSLINHQTNGLILGCWLGGCVAIRHERWWAAALLFALPGFKMYTWATGLVFAVLYPRQLVGRFAVAVLGVLILPFLLHPADAVLYRLESMKTYLVEGNHYRVFHYLTLYETFRQYVWPVSAASLLPVQALAGGLVPLIVLFLQRRGVSDADLIPHALFLVCLWCVSFGPSIEPQTYLLAAPAFGFYLARCVATPRPMLYLAIPLVAVAALSGSPLDASGPALRRWLGQSKISCVHFICLYGLLITVGSRSLLRAARSSRAEHTVLRTAQGNTQKPPRQSLAA